MKPRPAHSHCRRSTSSVDHAPSIDHPVTHSRQRVPAHSVLAHTTSASGTAKSAHQPWLNWPDTSLRSVTTNLSCYSRPHSHEPPPLPYAIATAYCSWWESRGSHRTGRLSITCPRPRRCTRRSWYRDTRLRRWRSVLVDFNDRLLCRRQRAHPSRWGTQACPRRPWSRGESTTDRNASPGQWWRRRRTCCAPPPPPR